MPCGGTCVCVVQRQQTCEFRRKNIKERCTNDENANNSRHSFSTSCTSDIVQKLFSPSFFSNVKLFFLILTSKDVEINEPRV